MSKDTLIIQSTLIDQSQLALSADQPARAVVPENFLAGNRRKFFTNCGAGIIILGSPFLLPKQAKAQMPFSPILIPCFISLLQAIKEAFSVNEPANVDIQIENREHQECNGPVCMELIKSESITSFMQYHDWYHVPARSRNTYRVTVRSNALAQAGQYLLRTSTAKSQLSVPISLV